MRSLVLCICLLIVFGLHGQNDWEDRIFDWSNAGLETPIDNDQYQINFLDHGGDNTGANDNSPLLQELIDNAPEFTTIYFPSGEYLFESSINLRSNISILGKSAEHTKFIFNLNGAGHCFRIGGAKMELLSSFADGASLKDQMISVESSSAFERNQLILIEPDDADLVSSNWAIGTTGQITKIEEVFNNHISIADELRRNYSPNSVTAVFRIEPIENVSFSKFKIERLDETVSQTSNFYFHFAYNCHISCVESLKANFGHATISYSYHTEVASSRFEYGFNYGGGGKAYGAVIQNTSSSCLVFNNIFNHLRHSMLLQSGANGNVVAYNFSHDPYWQGTIYNDDAAGDLVLHGNYPYANLFEGNVVQNIVIDQSHGSNGPLNTFFRNRAENYGLLCANIFKTDYLNIIGNEIANSELGRGLFLIHGDHHFVHANNVRGLMDSSEMDWLTKPSLFLESDPFESEDISWPVIAYPEEFNQSSQLAQLTHFNQADLCIPHIKEDIEEPASDILNIYPNPTNGMLQIDLGNDNLINKVSLINCIGKNVFEKEIEGSIEIDLSFLPQGIYFIQLYSGKRLMSIKKLMIN